MIPVGTDSNGNKIWHMGLTPRIYKETKNQWSAITNTEQELLTYMDTLKKGNEVFLKVYLQNHIIDKLEEQRDKQEKSQKKLKRQLEWQAQYAVPTTRRRTRVNYSLDDDPKEFEGPEFVYVDQGSDDSSDASEEYDEEEKGQESSDDESQGNANDSESKESNSNDFESKESNSNDCESKESNSNDFESNSNESHSNENESCELDGNGLNQSQEANVESEASSQVGDVDTKGMSLALLAEKENTVNVL